MPTRLCSSVLLLVAVSWSAAGVASEGDDGDGDESRTAQVEVTDIAVGGKHACAVVGSGRVYCWGRNSDGQLGDGTKEQRNRPVPVQGIDDAEQVETGAAHTCVRHATGRGLVLGVRICE